MVQPSEEYNIFSVFIYDLWRMRGMVEVSLIGGCNTNSGEFKGTGCNVRKFKGIANIILFYSYFYIFMHELLRPRVSLCLINEELFGDF